MILRTLQRFDTVFNLWIYLMLFTSPLFTTAQYNGTHNRYLRDQAAMKRGDSQTSNSTSLYLVSYDDFCLLGPSNPFAYIESDSSSDLVSWCSKAGHNTRLIPDNTLHGVTYVQADSWVQVSGVGDFTKINLAPGDGGGQLSPSNTGNGIAVYTSDSNTQTSSWVMIISATTFCFRACSDATWCPTEYANLGCYFFTGDQVGAQGNWQNCVSDNNDPPGVISSSTYSPGSSPTPRPSDPAPSSCSTGSSVANGQSPPPMYSWTGGGGAAATGTGGDGVKSGSNSGSVTLMSGSSESGSLNSGASTTSSASWVLVTTCTPCGSSASTSGSLSLGGQSTIISSSSSASGSTFEAGITQVTIGASLSSGGSNANDLTLNRRRRGFSLDSNPYQDFIKRQEAGAQTSSKSCCTTIWTQATESSTSVAGASVTSSSSQSSPTLADSSTATITSSHIASSSSEGSSVSSANPTLSSGISSNGSNSTNSTSGTERRVAGIVWDMEAIIGGWEILVAVMAGAFTIMISSSFN